MITKLQIESFELSVFFASFIVMIVLGGVFMGQILKKEGGERKRLNKMLPNLMIFVIFNSLFFIRRFYEEVGLILTVLEIILTIYLLYYNYKMLEIYNKFERNIVLGAVGSAIALVIFIVLRDITEFLVFDILVSVLVIFLLSFTYSAIVSYAITSEKMSFYERIKA